MSNASPWLNVKRNIVIKSNYRRSAWFSSTLSAKSSASKLVKRFYRSGALHSWTPLGPEAGWWIFHGCHAGLQKEWQTPKAVHWMQIFLNAKSYVRKFASVQVQTFVDPRCCWKSDCTKTNFRHQNDYSTTMPCNSGIRVGVQGCVWVLVCACESRTVPKGN